MFRLNFQNIESICLKKMINELANHIESVPGYHGDPFGLSHFWALNA